MLSSVTPTQAAALGISLLPAGAEYSQLFPWSLPMLGVTLHDPASGACLLHLFVKIGHPTSGNKDNQRKQEHAKLLCSHVYSTSTEGAAALCCQHPRRLADQGTLAAHLGSVGTQEHFSDPFAVGLLSCILSVHRSIADSSSFQEGAGHCLQTCCW